MKMQKKISVKVQNDLLQDSKGKISRITCNGKGKDKISSIFIQLPESAAFDTYSLKQDQQDEIKSVE